MHSDADSDFDCLYADAPYGVGSDNPNEAGRGFGDNIEDTDFLKYAEKTFHVLKRGS